MRLSRGEILEGVHARINSGEALVLAGAGVGLVASAAAAADVDLLMTYNIAKFRMDGNPSIVGYLPYGDANAITLELAPSIIAAARDVPVIAGVGAADPYRTIGQLLDAMCAAGFSGVVNTPTAGAYEGELRRQMEEAGIGYSREIELTRQARARDIFTVMYAFDEETAADLVRSGADVVAAHLGNTAQAANPEEAVAEAIRRTQAMVEAARSVDPNAVVVAHGGPLEDAATVALVLDATDAMGYIAGSSLERLPVVASVREAACRMRTLRLRNVTTPGSGSA